jgi:hypothetical protein
MWIQKLTSTHRDTTTMSEQLGFQQQWAMAIKTMKNAMYDQQLGENKRRHFENPKTFRGDWNIHPGCSPFLARIW